jgi:hypothetical protein
MTSTTYNANGERETALAKALAFFDRNPDEELTRDDIATKFDCCRKTASMVAKALIREGVPRNQLPRTPQTRRRTGTPPGPFPHCLWPSERNAIEAFMREGSIAAAAAAEGLTYRTIEASLRDARKKAGVHTTPALVELYQQHQPVAA